MRSTNCCGVAEVSGLVRVRERENLIEGGDLVAGHHFGGRESVEQLAAVQRVQLGPREVVDELADVRVLRVAGEGGAGVGALLGLDGRVVPHHRCTVLGEDDVEFQRGDTQLDGLGERAQRFLGGLAASAAVRLQVEVAGIGRCDGHGRQREGGQQGADACEHPRRVTGPGKWPVNDN